MGFTLIELLVAITIMGVLLGATLIRYTTYNEQQQVKQAALTLITNIQQARSDAMSGKKPDTTGCSTTKPLEGYKVSFTQTSYTITPRCNGVDISSAKTTVLLPTGVSFSPVPIPSSFIYLPLTKGVTSVPSQIILTNGNYSVTLHVDATSGSISE